MECKMNYPEKQLKYSIRKVSVGAASVVIGALYLLMGAGIAHADGMESAREANRTANPADADQSGTGEPENKADLNNTDAAASTYNAPVAENPLVAPEAAKPRRTKRELPDGDASNPSNGATGTESGNNQPTGENSPVLDANRKGETVKDDQPGVHVPKDGESGSDDKNAHLRFDDPGENATVEEMWKIIQKMPDDFQNNERSYLRNMDTLGNALRFDKTEANPEGVPLKPGEIREISSFGGWTAIMKKDGETGKFAIGMKNEQGYFTGWYTDKDGKRQEGGMLGSDALDQIYVHEQALDRRFKYMLMLAKGRTIANRNDKAQDGTEFKIKTENSAANHETLKDLPVKDKDDILQRSPNIEGFNGIEKTFTAFSTKYGSRLKIDFVTGYISDFFGSKGTYRIVVKAIKKDKTDNSKEVEETIYDHTINRIDGIVENEERYSQGVNLSTVNDALKKMLKREYETKVNNLAKERYMKDHNTTRPPRLRDYEYLKPIIEKELAEKGDVRFELPIDRDKLQEEGKNTFKAGTPFTSGYSRIANELQTALKSIEDGEVQQNSPIWKTPQEKNSEGTTKSQDLDRVYKLLNFILPTAKKIIYHADTDQLELQTDPEKVKSHRAELEEKLKAKQAELETADETKKTELKKEISALKSAIGSTNAYTYLEARNGKKAIIRGSLMTASEQPDTRVLPEEKYNKIRTNELALNEKKGFEEFTKYFVEEDKVKRSDVISDEKLSEEITKAIEGDTNKLGKGGYFSTGDIPLDKDVVAYKIQVFAENEKRVGVNKQSPRLQYNLPILADFSVIQDTVEPSKEVAKRIIEKQVKENKIPPEEGEKLKRKIDESKKTSEVRKSISGNVKVRYVDEQGQDIPLSDEEAKKVGEKSDNGTYLVEKEALIGSSYDVTSKQLRGINTGEKKYRLKRSLNAVTGEVTSTDKVVTFVYEEGEATKAKAVVHVMKQQDGGTTVELPEHKLNLETEVGEEFPSTDVDAKVAALKKAGYEIVGNTFTNGTPESRKGDDQEDLDGQEPTQSYTITVQERTKEVTEPPTPNTPVDPTIPDGPKWPETGLKESDLKAEVTRTITYVKKESPDGAEEPSGIASKIDKVLFKRTATYNLVTKKITYGEWMATTDESHPASELPAVDTPLKTGYVADIKQVEGQDAPKPTKTGEVTNIEKKVVYTKLGSWVPKIPGKDSTPIPYPNDPDDPTKPKTPTYPENPETPGETPNPQPGDPTDPNIPNVPVIPYVPGYTPKIGETPLQPKVPGDPTKGYIPPSIPTEPGTDTEISYVPDSQRALVKVYNVKDGVKIPLENDTVGINDGKTDQAIPTKSLEDKIKELEKRGYTVDNKDLLKGKVFDNQKDPENGDPTQVYDLLVRERISLDTETKAVTRTIKYVKIEEQNGAEVEVENAQPTNTQTVNFSRDISINLATGRISNGKWSEKQILGEVKTPVLEGYLADRAKVESREVTGDSESFEEKVVYRKIGSWIPKVPGKEEPTPIPYPNDPDDPTKPKTPDYPTTPPQPGQPVPKVPVIPYVPGYTPKTPNGTPLVPIDPEHPEKGYKVPPVPETPNDPKMDTPITYEGNPQKILIKVVNVTTGVEVPLDNEKLEFNGKSGETVKETDKNSVDAKITSLRNRGYIVDTVNPLTATTKYDTESDDGKQEPTQTYKLVVREKISTDKESTTVTRTIKYVKIDVQDGNEVRTELNTEKIKTKVDKVEFSRNTTTNVTTGLTEIGAWNHEKQEFPKVDTPVLEGYLANKVSVPSKEVTPESDSIEEVVEYRKIGSWVPKVPGKEEPTPIPYPNDPDDPTKPKTPDYPTTPPQPGQPVPKVPVIPYVPGYTPKTPNGTPLVPIDPEHPEKGYKVPPVPETPNDPKTNTPIEYTPDGQRAIVKFVVVGEDGKETELVASRMSLTGKTGEKIPTENFNDTLKKLTGDPVNNGDYELVDNPLKDGATFDTIKDQEGKDPSQVFVVKLRHINVIPPTPRIVERPSGNTVEVDVPNKDADTLSITFTKRNSTEKETIVTKKDKDGTWKIEKSPVGVTINPTNGRVYIPSKQIQPKTWVDTQTKHKYKQSKIVRVMPNILDVPKFEGTTEWIDVNGHVLRPTEDGFHEKGRIANHVWLESRLEGNKVTHIFFAGSPSVDKPEYKITVWFDKDGNPLKPDQPGTHEAGNIPGYRYITTVTLDGITIHRFEKIPPVLPNEPNPDRPEEPRPQPNPEHPSAPTPTPELPNQETPIPVPDTPSPETPVSPDPEVPTDETGKREELPNTGTEANATLAGAGLLTLLAGLGLGFFKRKEDESE